MPIKAKIVALHIIGGQAVAIRLRRVVPLKLIIKIWLAKIDVGIGVITVSVAVTVPITILVNTMRILTIRPSNIRRKDKKTGNDQEEEDGFHLYLPFC